MLTIFEVSTPIPKDTFIFKTQKIRLKEGFNFRFKIQISGQYCINFKPLIQNEFTNDKIGINLISDGFLTKSNKVFYLSNNLSNPKACFTSKDNTIYEVNFEKIPKALTNKDYEISINEETATASKNLYFKQEFRPFYLSINKISLTLAIIFLSLFVSLKIFQKLKHRF
jgi:hypothetical protein